MCGRPAQVSSASERPKGGAADHGEPPHGMHPHRVSASLSEKEGSVVTAANHCFGHQRESAGRDRHMGTATCPTLGRRCSFSVLPLRWRSLANDDGRAVARRPTAARVNVGRKLWFTPHSGTARHGLALEELKQSRHTHPTSTTCGPGCAHLEFKIM